MSTYPAGSVYTTSANRVHNDSNLPKADEAKAMVSARDRNGENLYQPNELGWRGTMNHSPFPKYFNGLTDDEQ